MNTNTNHQMGPIEWLLLLVLSILWGGSFFFSEVALEALPPFTIVFSRLALATIVLNLVVRLRGERLPLNRKIWGRFFVMGAINNFLPFSLIVWGQTQITGGLASILNATAPLWTVILAHFFTRDERLTGNRLGGVIIGLAGVSVMVGTDALEGIGLNVVAQLAVIAAALSYAFAGIYGKRFRGQPPIVTATGQVSASTLLLAPIMLIVDRPWVLATPPPVSLSAVLGLGILSTALAYIIYFYLLARAGATNLLLVALLIPMSALLLGALFLGENVQAVDLAGMAMIGAGLLFIDGRLTHRLASRPAPS